MLFKIKELDGALKAKTQNHFFLVLDQMPIIILSDQEIPTRVTCVRMERTLKASCLNRWNMGHALT